MDVCTSDPRFALRIAGILAIGCLVFNLVAIPVTREQWIYNPGDLFPVGWIILAGFMLILVFDGVAVIHALFRYLAKRAVFTDILILAGGSVCILLLGGEKAMIDEIARETRYGTGVHGEWLVLYAGFAVQLSYTLWVVFHLGHPIRPAR